VVDDEPDVILEPLRLLLSGEFEVLTADSAAAAEAVLARRPVDVVLADQRMPGRTGVQLLEWVRRHHPRTVRLLMTGHVEVEDAVEAINRGHVYYYVAKPWRTGELLQLLRNAAEKSQLERSRDRLLDELRRSNQELEEANERLQQRTRDLERLALTDGLTGLFNRRAIEELARFELKRHLRYHRPLSLGLVEVDQVGLLHGDPLRPGGDEVIEEVASVLAGLLREMDSVGRLHGATFLVVARETGAEGAARLGERLRAAVGAAPFDCNGQAVPVTLSVGFAVADGGGRADPEAMINLAAAALSIARAAGRNRCEVRRLPAPLPDDV
jgi:diguanylate cyclase (GGDEF)-like protein